MEFVEAINFHAALCGVLSKFKIHTFNSGIHCHLQPMFFASSVSLAHTNKACGKEIDRKDHGHLARAAKRLHPATVAPRLHQAQPITSKASHTVSCTYVRKVRYRMC